MSAVPATTPRAGMASSIAIVGGLFFILGFCTWINGPLITFVKLAFEVSEVSAFLVLMVFYLSYFFFALPASWILKRTGMKKGLALGLFVMAVGAALFPGLGDGALCGEPFLHHGIIRAGLCAEALDHRLAGEIRGFAAGIEVTVLRALHLDLLLSLCGGCRRVAPDHPRMSRTI